MEHKRITEISYSTNMRNSEQYPPGKQNRQEISCKSDYQDQDKVCGKFSEEQHPPGKQNRHHLSREVDHSRKTAEVDHS